MKNSPARYGFVTKALHWTVFVLILNQFVAAAMMLNTPQGQTTAGFTQGTLYNWHKSIGLVLLLVVLARYIWRKTTPLPDWAPNLSAGEKRALNRIEPLLYLCMFLMPISGFVFVMAGGYGVNFFGVWHMPELHRQARPAVEGRRVDAHRHGGAAAPHAPRPLDARHPPPVAAPRPVSPPDAAVHAPEVIG